MDALDLLAAIRENQEASAAWQELIEGGAYPHPYARERLDASQARVERVLNAIIDKRIAAYFSNMTVNLVVSRPDPSGLEHMPMRKVSTWNPDADPGWDAPPHWPDDGVRP